MDVGAARSDGDAGSADAHRHANAGMEKLNRNGPTDVLRRHVHPTGSLVFGDKASPQRSCTYACAEGIIQIECIDALQPMTGVGARRRISGPPPCADLFIDQVEPQKLLERIGGGEGVSGIGGERESLA